MSSLALVLRLGERVWLVVFFRNNLLRAACRITKGLAVLQVIYLGRCRRCNEYGTIMRMDEAVAKSQKTKKLGRSSKSDLSCVFCVSLLSARERGWHLLLEIAKIGCGIKFSLSSQWLKENVPASKMKYMVKRGSSKYNNGVKLHCTKRKKKQMQDDDSAMAA